MARRSAVAAAVALSLGLTFAACSEDTGVSDGAPPGEGALPAPGDSTAATVATDPGYATCDVVPVEVVNRNLGLDLPAGRQRDNEPDARSCQYGEFSFDGPGDVQVNLYIAPDETIAQSIFDDVVFIVSARPVDGVGDEAAEALFSSRVLVRQGNVVVDVFGESGQARLGSDGPELRALALEILGSAASLPGAAT
ncbi:MAG: hypothetical protein H0W25_01105, partial [Acidimicrobiia bacterium]|nr:hypothetical protein [Acidimicrobiia bacterium]